ncbi:MAG TPA: hypothetical protein PLG15_01380 [Candidatus Gastranaerophilaceae bacterium]|nr:hypothetical protein [Candidatus Gastranaerophilaceae bacterium]HPT41019.1 hypothetical protein [Candidatus Gastranaerophilaceae bacterium]
MKKYLILLLISLVIFVALPVFAAKAPVQQATQLEKRAYQTRSFDGLDKATIMKAMLNVLQDEGFIVNNANPLLGFISGSKEFDVTDKTIDVQKEFGIKKGALAMKGIRVATIEATANVSEFGKEIRVRINFKRKLLNTYGNAQFIDEISDEKYYQDFFSKVDKAIFIQRQKI